jgi:hypothetical protein
MAYAIPKDAECTEGGCTRRAEYIVKNNRNETIRECCRRHADALVRRLSAEEDERTSRG